MNIYDKIDLFLKAKGMSRRQLALASGIPESTFAAAFARKTKSFAVGNLVRICGILDVDFAEFINDVEGLELKTDASADIMAEVQKDRTVRVEKVRNLLLIGDDPKTAEALLDVYCLLNADGQKKIFEYAKDIAGNEKYKKTQKNSRY